MLIGYNTNGFAFHRLEDAIDIIADGYGCVALTVDYGRLNPFDADIGAQADRIAEQLGSLGLTSVIETGARFLLDPLRKHQPTLLDRRGAGRERREDFVRRCVDLAARLRSPVVSLWSGALPPRQEEAAAFDLLVGSCVSLCDHAAEEGVVLAFEPEPGMLVDTLDQYDRLARAVDRDNFRLTIDVGHLHCTETGPASAFIKAHAGQLANVHLDDMRAGVHDHLFFGEGEVDFDDTFAALRAARYEGPACVELSRHSHNAVEAATRAKTFLDAFTKGA